MRPLRDSHFRTFNDTSWPNAAVPDAPTTGARVDPSLSVATDRFPPSHLEPTAIRNVSVAPLIGSIGHVRWNFPHFDYLRFATINIHRKLGLFFL
jgi:hypothetical protein